MVMVSSSARILDTLLYFFFPILTDILVLRMRYIISDIFYEGMDYLIIHPICTKTLKYYDRAYMTEVYNELV